MSQSFWELLGTNFKSVLNAIIGVASFLASLALWLLVPGTEVSLGLVVPIVTVILVLLLMAVFTLFNAAYDAHKKANAVQAEYEDYKARGGLPKVRRSFDTLETEGEMVCLLEPSELFSYDTLASFYNVDSQGFELLIAVGVVTIVQSDGKIQVSLLEVVKGHEELAERLRRNDAEMLRTIHVKPGVPRRYAGLLLQEGRG